MPETVVFGKRSLPETVVFGKRSLPETVVFGKRSLSETVVFGSVQKYIKRCLVFRLIWDIIFFRFWSLTLIKSAPID